MRRLTLDAALTALAFTVACAAPKEAGCTPGKSEACTGVGGCSGGQTCNADGMGYGLCECGTVTPTDGGSQDAESADAGIDGGVSDGGVMTCNIVTQTGCDSTNRCTWITLADGGGGPGCAADGTQAANTACTVGTNGVDDCVRGTVCVLGTCLTACDSLNSSSCAGPFVCGWHGGFGDEQGGDGLGFCEPTCDPVTQERTFDGAAACGSTDPMNPNRGCYGYNTFTCASVSSLALTQRHRDVAFGPSPGAAYANGCAPGYIPLLREYGGQDPLCIALCRPAETSKGNTANEDGVAPNTCAARGATGVSAECRFLHFVENRSDPSWVPSAWSNTVGFCLDYDLYAYDHDMNPGTADVTYPSCGSIDAGSSESIDWGCAPAPAM